MQRWIYRIGAIALAVSMLPSAAMAANSGEAAGGSWFMFGFFVANFVLFVYIVVRYSKSLTRSYFSDRATGIRTNLARAEDALNKAKAMAAAATDRKVALAADLARIKAEFETETSYQISRIKETAETSAERLRRDRVATVTALTEAARRRVRERIVAAAAARARGLITGGFGSDDQSRLIESFMDKLGEEALI